MATESASAPFHENAAASAKNDRLAIEDEDQVPFEENRDGQSEEGSTYCYSYTKVWTIAATKLFISMYKELKNNSSLNGFSPTQRIIWQTISTSLRSFGFDYTPLQVENRYKSLKRSYLKKANGRRGRYTERWGHPFSKDMIELFGQGSSKETVGDHEASTSHEHPESAAGNSFSPSRAFHVGLTACGDSEFILGGTTTSDSLQKIKEEEHEIVEMDADEVHCGGRRTRSRSSTPFSSDSARNALEGCSYHFAQPSLSRPEARTSLPPPPPDSLPSVAMPEFFQLLREDLKEHRRIREANRNKRHKEKMDLLKKILAALEKDS